MLWFGIPVFDNRYEITEPYGAEDIGQKGASHLLYPRLFSRGVGTRRVLRYSDVGGTCS